MYEFRREPGREHIMRHAAWEINQATLARCRALDAEVGTPMTYCLTTALGLLGHRAPPSCELSDNALHVVFPDPVLYRRADHMRSYIWKPAQLDGTIISIDGIRCTSPAATFAHLARRCSLRDRVAMADALMCRDSQLRRAARRDLSSFLTSSGRFVGIRDAQWALGLACENTDSPAETRMRLSGRQWGLPPMQINININPQTNSECYIDMGWPAYRVGMEYHGAHHVNQAKSDTLRGNILAAHGWRVLQAYADTFANAARERQFFRQVALTLQAAGDADATILWDKLPLEQVAGPRPRPGRGGVPAMGIDTHRRQWADSSTGAATDGTASLEFR